MIPVTQTKVVVNNSKGEVIVRGNCLAACIASLLEMPITEVPNVEVFYHIDEPFYWEVLWRWLTSFGYELVTDERFRCFHGDESKNEFKEALKNEYYLVSGKSPRGVQHVCIYKNGQLMHDPHPSREGLLTEEYFERLEKVDVGSLSDNGQLLCEGRAVEKLNLNKLLKMNNENKVEVIQSSPDFAKQMLGDASGEMWSLHEQVVSGFHKKVWSDFDKKLREYVTKHLNDLGYQFATDDEFIEFVKARLHRIGFEDKPHYYELYLDFVDNENKGAFIGSYSDNVDISWKDSTVTATIGRSIA